MTTDLQKSKTVIEEHNKTLEQKVADRTQELQQNLRKLRMTERRLNEYASDLQRSNTELEQFAYVASHDLQEPLRTTSGFINLLKQQYEDKLDKRANLYLGFITEASTRMEVLIKDLLDYSRIGSNKVLETIDCNDTLRTVIADLQLGILETGACIRSGHLPTIRAYPTELKQLFQILIANACKFRQQDIAPQIDISATLADDCWQFAFSDNGIGIEKQHNERIFVIFQRLHNRSQYIGSGIGLSHCKKIVEMHNGRIWVESIPGEGSTFYFTIPNV